MYRYLTKGLVIGSLLTSKLLRTITSIPGLVIDFGISLFWYPNFAAYWEDPQMTYFDGEKTSGFRGLFGFIGEIIGILVGLPVGCVIGLGIYLVDSVLYNIREAQIALGESLISFAKWLPQSPFFSHFTLEKKPTQFWLYAFNIGAALLGGLVAAPFYLFFKTLEFIFPSLESEASSAVLSIISGLAGTVIFAASILLFPVVYLLEKVGQLYDGVRDNFQTALAIIYAKSGREPSTNINPEDLDALYSEEFRDKVANHRDLSWEVIIFGLRQGAEENPPAIALESMNADVDSLTLDVLGDNNLQVIIDPHGHRFNNYGKGKGIFQWVNSHHNCPISREPLEANQFRFE
ncbi:MAG: hypothetical protein ACHP6H_03705 [Legionellales bacterium]